MVCSSVSGHTIDRITHCQFCSVILAQCLQLIKSQLAKMSQKCNVSLRPVPSITSFTNKSLNLFFCRARYTVRLLQRDIILCTATHLNQQIQRPRVLMALFNNTLF
jgi:hypothetical protein